MSVSVPQRRSTALALPVVPRLLAAGWTAALAVLLVNLFTSTSVATGCLHASGWISELGLRWALLHPDGTCSSGTWAVTASGVAVLLTALATLVLVTGERGRSAGRRLNGVAWVMARRRRPAATAARQRVITVRIERGTGHHPSGCGALRGPPAR